MKCSWIKNQIQIVIADTQREAKLIQISRNYFKFQPKWNKTKQISNEPSKISKHLIFN
jgi:hypothetical protein